MQPTKPEFDANQRRRGIRRTVLIVAAVAVLIYVGFIASGVFASGVLSQ